MLDCYIRGKSLLVYVYAQFMHVYFRGSLAGETDKIGKKINFFIFIGYVPRFFEKHKFSYVPRFPEEHKLCSSVPMSMRTYIHQDMFLGEPRNISYVPRP
jgi:hypothetical protein